MIHLDTSFLIDLQRERTRTTTGVAVSWLEQHDGEPLGASVFVACELEAGARAAHPDRERSRVLELWTVIAIVCPNERFAAVYGRLLAQIQARGRAIGVMDLLIATTATFSLVSRAR